MINIIGIIIYSSYVIPTLVEWYKGEKPKRIEMATLVIFLCLTIDLINKLYK